MNHKNIKKLFIIALSIFSTSIFLSNEKHKNKEIKKSDSKQTIQSEINSILEKKPKEQKVHNENIKKVNSNKISSQKNSWRSYYSVKADNNKIAQWLHWNFGTKGDFEDYYNRHHFLYPAYEHFNRFQQNPNNKKFLERYKNVISELSEIDLEINSNWKKYTIAKQTIKQYPNNRKLKNDLNQIQKYSYELDAKQKKLLQEQKTLANKLQINKQLLHFFSEPHQIEQYENYILGKHLAKNIQKTKQGKELLRNLRQLGLVGVKLNLIGSIMIRLTDENKFTKQAKQKLDRLTQQWSFKYTAAQNKSTALFEKLRIQDEDQKALQNYMEEKGEDAVVSSYVKTARINPIANKIFNQYELNINNMNKTLSKVFPKKY